MRTLFGVFLAAAFLSGCATELMTEEECLVGDWYGAGLEDGAEGRLPRAYDERVALCQSYGAPADAGPYWEGRDLALGRLCTEGGGYAFGRAGKAYLGVCAAEDEPGFLSGYLQGRRVHEAELVRSRAESAYNSAVYSVDSYRSDIRRARRVLRDEESTDKEIARAREDIRDARDSLPYAERQVDERLYELGRADEALRRIIDSSPGWAQSREFASIHALLREAYEFARADEGIDFCTDDQARFAPRCEIVPGARLIDRETGGVCAAGPGEARFVDRRTAGVNGALQRYEVYPSDPETGRASRRPAGRFTVYFGPDGGYEGLACVAAPAPAGR